MGTDGYTDSFLQIQLLVVGSKTRANNSTAAGGYRWTAQATNGLEGAGNGLEEAANGRSRLQIDQRGLGMDWRRLRMDGVGYKQTQQATNRRSRLQIGGGGYR